MNYRKKSSRFDITGLLYLAIVINCMGVVFGEANICALSNIFVVIYLLKVDFYWER